MFKKLISMIAVMLMASSCASVKNNLGLGAEAPNEYAVPVTKELVVPPVFLTPEPVFYAPGPTEAIELEGGPVIEREVIVGRPVGSERALLNKIRKDRGR